MSYDFLKERLENPERRESPERLGPREKTELMERKEGPELRVLPGRRAFRDQEANQVSTEVQGPRAQRD
jgi:hypothetical protein